jgi:hypothetical protein
MGREGLKLKFFMIISLFLFIFPLFADELAEIKNAVPEIEMSALVVVLKDNGTLVFSDQVMDLKIHTLHYRFTIEGHEIPNFYVPQKKFSWTPYLIGGGIGLIVGGVIVAVIK